MALQAVHLIDTPSPPPNHTLSANTVAASALNLYFYIHKPFFERLGSFQPGQVNQEDCRAEGKETRQSHGSGP